MKALALKALAPGTLRAYSAAWGDWQEYMASSGRGKSWQDAILEFVWLWHERGRSKAAMSSALAGISYFSRLEGLIDPTKSFILARALRGWAKEQLRFSDDRRPIDIGLLKDLVTAVSGIALGDYEINLFSLAFVLAFFGALRIGELVAKSKRSAETGVMAGDVVIKRDMMLVKIQRSKMDQLGKGKWISVPAHPEPSICPVKLAEIYCQNRPSGGRQWLVHRDLIPLSRFQFTSVFKKCLIALDLPLEQYGTHSFRIGAATCAAAAGSSGEEIKRLGRWKSDAYKGYICGDKLR
ncbi:integrase/recombinase xerD homolog [Pseudophryne corroboree]|uniref:integrase/recombinase xerD homolog n=1 Tax=Pseudophryne corroboree TaxID=495146 RepID=UPI0030813462